MKFSILKFSKGYLFKWTNFSINMLSMFLLITFSLSPQLQDYAEYMGSHARVILVPSIRDANHDFVFPQVVILKHQTNIDYAVNFLQFRLCLNILTLKQ